MKNLSENLLSLSHFAEAGYVTYLDDKVVHILNPKMKKIFAFQVYEKLYWLIKFVIKTKVMILQQELKRR